MGKVEIYTTSFGEAGHGDEVLPDGRHVERLNPDDRSIATVSKAEAHDSMAFHLMRAMVSRVDERLRKREFSRVRFEGCTVGYKMLTCT